MTRKPWLLRRFGAMLYDLFIVAALWMLTGALSLVATGGGMNVNDPPWWYSLALVLVTLAYFVLSWCRLGQTIGMRAWRLRLSTLDGAAVPWSWAVLRFFLAGLSLALAGAGFWWAWLDSRHQTLHDKLCRTTMERVDKK